MYPYGLIGNCQTSALVSADGEVSWLCLPRPDSPPVLGKLLDSEGGHFAITPDGKYQSTQHYLPNTNILVTHFVCEDGSEFQITDFCPRFEQHGRLYRPMSLFRIVEPLVGTPNIKVTFHPINGWEKERVGPIRGNSHLKFEIRGDVLRLATNMSLTYLIEETTFVARERLFFGLTWGAGIEDNLPLIAQQFLDQTATYWRLWVKHCSIPVLFQEETIRSALTLKLHCFEDTGAILAALTTSLPEEVGHGRNWDYRFCWLRDAAFVLSAFHNLGHFEEMEGFIKFLLNIAHQHEHSGERLRPVYALDQSLPLPEINHSNWSGFERSSPVRSNNQAAEHVQNDVYGELILTLAPIFFDERFQHLRTPEHEDLLQNLANMCISTISQLDAGLWEIRNGWQEHSFSNLMCWAGIERTLRVKECGFLKQMDKSVLVMAKAQAETAIFRAVKDGSLRNGPNDESFDSALLLLPVLRFEDLELCKKTTEDIANALQMKDANGFLFRYTRKDDFGAPSSAFLICSFWLVQALSRIGKDKQAMEIMKSTLTAQNHLGLLAEHFIPSKKQQCGNFPQAYSHVGLINAAFAVSPKWSEIL